MDYQKYVLGAVVKNGYEAYIDCSEIINEESFDNMRDAVIWSIYKEAYEGNNPPKRISGPEYMSIAKRLGFESEIRNNFQYMKELNAMDTEPQAVIRAAKVLKKEQVKRDLLMKMQLAKNTLENMPVDTSTSIDAIIGAVENPIFEYISSLSADTNQIRKMADGARNYINDLIGNPRENIGLPSFINEWNEAVGGGYRPGVDIVSARKKVGKSNYILSTIRHLSGKDLRIPVLYIDKEMPLEAGWVRFISSLSKVPIKNIETGRVDPCSKYHTAILKAQDEYEDMPIYYLNASGISFDEMLSMIRRWLIRYVGYGENGKIKPCLIAYDYFKINSENALGDLAEYQLLGFQATKFADLALKYGVCILGMVQSNRQGVVSQSDRLSWLCNSLFYLTIPEDEELIANPHLGNRKFMFDCCRFGPGLLPNDFIALKLEGQYSRIEVLGLASKIAKNRGEKNDDDNSESNLF